MNTFKAIVFLLNFKNFWKIALMLNKKIEICLNFLFLPKAESHFFLVSLLFLEENSWCLKCWQIFSLSVFFNINVLYEIVLQWLK